MGRWVHRLSELDLQAMTAICSACGPTNVYRSGESARCSASKLKSNKAYQDRRGPYYGRRRQFAATHGKCDRCGFVAADACQLDVDHVDGDWTNDEDNWQVLCANCHRLKTHRPGKYAA